MREWARKGSRVTGFSMVELLVVIAIIMVVAAILFPVLARAKARAKQTTCMSNLHQLAMAIELGNTMGGDLCPLAPDYPGASYYFLSDPKMIEAMEPVDPGHARIVCYRHGEKRGPGVGPSDFSGTVVRVRQEGSVQVRSVGLSCLDGVPMRPDWMLFSDEPCPPEFCPAGLQPCP